MGKKCTSCGILLDVPCTNPACTGHQNTPMGDLCYYCATNQRTTPSPLPEAHSLDHSSLSHVDVDWEEA